MVAPATRQSWVTGPGGGDGYVAALAAAVDRSADLQVISAY
jgi:hypothetical protein